MIGLGQLLFTVYTYLRTRGYVCMSVCCSRPSDEQSHEVDVYFDVILPFSPMPMEVKETWVWRFNSYKFF